MGFEPPRKVFKLIFEDPAYAGLEVGMYELPLGDMLDLVEKAGGVDVTNFSVEDIAAVRELVAVVAANMKSWNVEIPLGTPVAPSPEVLLKQGTTMTMGIVHAWLAAMGDVADPLAGSSPSTPPPDLSSIPMAPLATSLAS